MNKVSITARLTCVHLDKHLCDQGVGENECVIVWIRDTVGESSLKSRRLALLKHDHDEMSAVSNTSYALGGHRG